MTELRGMGGARIVESSKLTQLWRDLCSAGKWLPESSPLVTHCQAELWELMRQIDIMMDNKQREWKAANESLQLRLQAREKECITDRTVIDQKNKEVLELRGQLANAEKTHKDAIIGYTTQVTKLRDEVARLKKHYEKMKARHAHDKTKATKELEGSLVELHRVQLELEEHKRLYDSADAQKKILQNQLDTYEAQQKSWAEKYDSMQQQASANQAQVQKRKLQLVEVENSLKAQVRKLEGELATAHGTVNGQKSEIDKLRTLELSLRTRLQQLEREISSHNSEDKQVFSATIQRLEAEVRSLTAELRHQVSPARKTVAADLSSPRVDGSPSQEREIARLEGYLHEKDSIIRELVQKTHSAIDESVIVENLRESIARADERNRKLSEKEVDLRLETVRLRADCEDLRHRLSSYDLECQSLREQLQDKAEEFRRLELCEVKGRDAELAQIKKQLQNTEERHSAEAAALRTEIVRLESQLEAAAADRDRLLNQSSFIDDSASECCSVNNRHSVSRSAAAVEERLRKAEAMSDTHASAIKIANSQLDALRLENRLLKEHVVKLSQSNVDRLEAESHLREIERLLAAAARQGAAAAAAGGCSSSDAGSEGGRVHVRHHSGASLAQLEDENESLRQIVERLQGKLLGYSLPQAADDRMPLAAAATGSTHQERDIRLESSAAVGTNSLPGHASAETSRNAGGGEGGAMPLVRSHSSGSPTAATAASGAALSAVAGVQLPKAAACGGETGGGAGVSEAAGDDSCRQRSPWVIGGSTGRNTNPQSPVADDKGTFHRSAAQPNVSMHDVTAPYQLPLTPQTDGRRSNSCHSDPDVSRQRTPLVPTATHWQTTTPIPSPSGAGALPQQTGAHGGASWRTPPRKAGEAPVGDRAEASRTVNHPRESHSAAVDEHTRRWLLDRPLVTPDEHDLLRKQIDRTSRQLESLNSTFIAQSLDDSLLSDYPERLRAASLCSRTDVDSLSQAFDISFDDFSERPESASARFLEEREQRAKELQQLLSRRLMDLHGVGSVQSVGQRLDPRN